MKTFRSINLPKCQTRVPLHRLAKKGSVPFPLTYLSPSLGEPEASLGRKLEATFQVAPNKGRLEMAKNFDVDVMALLSVT